MTDASPAGSPESASTWEGEFPESASDPAVITIDIDIVDPHPARTEVLQAINQERDRQEQLWGEDSATHQDPLTALPILIEEVGEVASAIIGHHFAYHPAHRRHHLYTELIQVAAVATAMAERLIPPRSTRHPCNAAGCPCTDFDPQKAPAGAVGTCNCRHSQTWHPPLIEPVAH